MKTGHSMPSDATLDLLRELVSFDTTSRKSNLGLIESVRDRLRRQGVDTRLSYDASAGKANLFATIGESRNGGLILSGHTDVVPVDGQRWSTDPFIADVRNGRLYARGSCDMKGFIACALSAVPKLLQMATARPFHLALSYDEEVGCIGVRSLIADLAELGIRPAACVVGEPTSMKLATSHKGHRKILCCVRGEEGHASDPGRALNAIEVAAKLIVHVQRLAEREATDGHRDPGFAVPHSTMSCTMIHGGIAANVIPRDCEFTIDMRWLPGVDPDRLVEELRCGPDRMMLPEMRRHSAGAAITWTVLNDSPALADDPASRVVELVRRAVSDPVAGRVAFNTEAGLFQRAGIPTVVCGPGSIDQAHRPDEYVELSQLSECERFVFELATEFQSMNLI